MVMSVKSALRIWLTISTHRSRTDLRRKAPSKTPRRRRPSRAKVSATQTAHANCARCAGCFSHRLNALPMGAGRSRRIRRRTRSGRLRRSPVTGPRASCPT
uniref:Uncharacterized protein n=1 Tax=Triticum urartu TaxID=4572 RepID=A0A8R7QPN7_TRIUA